MKTLVTCKPLRPKTERVVALLVALAVWLVAGTASAHAVGVSKGQYVLDGSTLRAEVILARGEMLGVVPSLDSDNDGTFDEADVARARPALSAAMTGGIRVRADGKPCAATFDGARLTEEDGIALSATYACARAPAKLDIDVHLLEELSHGHRHIVHAELGSITVDEVAYRGHEVVELAPGGAAGAGGADGRSSLDALGFLRMGIEHILSGYDHLVFLVGLVLVGGRVRSLFAVVTAFTVAHSITLGLAAFDVWVPPSRVVEPMIALSIAYVGVENFFVKSAEKRWRITFPFGLVHGFGFAGALREIELPRAQIPSALVMFNVGVELGQLAVMAILLPMVFQLRKQKGFVPRGVGALSGAVALAGAFWFVERIWRGG